MLDADEHLHLALHAISVRDHHAALTHLHEALAQRADDARALYLLGVQHAELGLVRRGIEGLTAALAVEPGMDMARFQLGLMLLDTGRVAEARQHLELLGRSTDASLRLYSQGMVALADGRTEAARQALAEGLSKEPQNAALAALMQRVLDGLGAGKDARANDVTPAAPVALGAYADRSGSR